MIQVFIVDDHAVVIEGLYSLLDREKDLKIIGHANTAEGCLQYFERATADIILMDIGLPDASGIELCTEIKKKYPGIMVLALSTFNEGTYIKKMMDNGASGYLLKNAERVEIVEAIKLAVKGKTYLSLDAYSALKAHNVQQASAPPLTKREKEVLQLVSEGNTTTQIADKLFISTDTVQSHRKNLHSKLNVNNTVQLIKVAQQNKLI